MVNNMDDSLRKSKMPQRQNQSAVPRTQDFSLLRKETDTSEFVESIGRNRRSKVHVVFRNEILVDASEKASPRQTASNDSISSTTPAQPA
jgi:hypothetical protein